MPLANYLFFLKLLSGMTFRDVLVHGSCKQTCVHLKENTLSVLSTQAHFTSIFKANECAVVDRLCHSVLGLISCSGFFYMDISWNVENNSMKHIKATHHVQYVNVMLFAIHSFAINIFIVGNLILP